MNNDNTAPLSYSMNSALRIDGPASPSYGSRSSEDLEELASNLFDVLAHELTDDDTAARCKRSLELIAETLEERGIIVPW